MLKKDLYRTTWKEIEKTLSDEQRRLKSAAEEGSSWVVMVQEDILEEILCSLKKIRLIDKSDDADRLLQDYKRELLSYRRNLRKCKNDEIFRRALIGNIFIILEEAIKERKTFSEIANEL